MNIIRVIGIMQIVCAIVLVYFVNNVDPGIADVTQRFAEGCKSCAEIIDAHKKIYKKSADNILSLQQSLRKTSDTAEATSKQVIKYGNWFLTPPKNWLLDVAWPKEKAENVGKHLCSVGEALKATSKALDKQADVLQDYQTKVYPQTELGFEKVQKAFSFASEKLNDLENSSRSNLRKISYVSSIIFFLNGFVLILLPLAIAKQVKKEPQENQA